MKLVKFLAYPVLVIALWVAFAAGTLSALRTLDTSLRSIAAEGQPAPVPAEATAPGQAPRVARVGSSDQRQSHPG
jgi:hypothetical protein